MNELSNEEKLYVIEALSKYYEIYVKPIEDKLNESESTINESLDFTSKKIEKITNKLLKIEKMQRYELEWDSKEILMILLMLSVLSLGSVKEIIDYIGINRFISIMGGIVGSAFLVDIILIKIEKSKTKKVKKMYVDLDALKKSEEQLLGTLAETKKFRRHCSSLKNTIENK